MLEREVLDFFDAHKFKYTLYRHSPVFTTQDKVLSVEPGKEGVQLDIPGLHFKSLFLKDKKSCKDGVDPKYYLVTVIGSKRVDLKKLASVVGASSLTFGSPEELMEYLKITPGSVSPFCLMFDHKNRVKFYLDQDYAAGEYVNFHPMRNDMTVGMAPVDFFECIKFMRGLNELCKGESAFDTLVSIISIAEKI